MKWYYAGNDGQRVGPLTETEFQAAVRDGQVKPDSLVWTQGMGDWLPYSDPAVPRPAAPAPATTAPQKDWDEVAQRVKEGVDPDTGATWEYGGFWIRFVAYFVDNIILQVVTFIVQFVIGMALVFVEDETLAIMITVFMVIVSVAISFGYYTFFHGNPNYQATPGKMLMKLRVITAEGEDVSYLRAFGRVWGAMLSGLLLAIGYIMAAFDEEKRTLHDHICNTRVIKR